MGDTIQGTKRSLSNKGNEALDTRPRSADLLDHEFVLIGDADQHN